ncbi:MAG: hypothetical protein H0X30_30785 [Anaerolineae bacterium]|nr:hypothetical protein [Anaerolineae bacterium]
MALRVFVDYNTISDDVQGRIHINTVVFKSLLELLQPDLPLVLFDEESLEVDAVAEYELEYDFWYGVPDWSTRRELPQLTKEQQDNVHKLMSLD